MGKAERCLVWWCLRTRSDNTADSGSGGSRQLFVTLRSSILPAKQKVDILDSYFEVQIGRDIAILGSVTPRIRLKELEVSKLHATAYWDVQERNGMWSIWVLNTALGS
jgi:hypothetical protein